MKSKKVKLDKAAKVSKKMDKKAKGPEMPQVKAVRIRKTQLEKSAGKYKIKEIISASKPAAKKNEILKGDKKKSKRKKNEYKISVDKKNKATTDKKIIVKEIPVVLKKAAAKNVPDKVEKKKGKKNTIRQVVENSLVTAKKLNKKDDVKVIITEEVKSLPIPSNKEKVKNNNSAVTISSKPNSIGWKYFLDKQGFPLMKIYTENPGVFFKLEKLSNIKKSARYYSHKGDLVGADFIVPYDLIQTACTIAGIKMPKNLAVAQPLSQAI